MIKACRKARYPAGGVKLYILPDVKCNRSENGRYIILECDDGNAYYNDEVKRNDNFRNGVKYEDSKRNR